MLCASCKDKTCLKSGKPCKSAEEELRKEEIYSSGYIRPELPSNYDRTTWGKLREVPFSNLRKEDKRAVEKKLGKGYWSE